MKTLLALATYNEIDNLPALLTAVREAAPDLDVLVVDDNSPDGTGKWLAEAAEHQSRLSAIHRSGKLGLGSAAVVGLRHAIEHHYDWVLNMDADFSHPPERLPDLLALAESGGYDVIVGARYARGGRITGWPLRRRLISRAVNFYARWMLWLPVSDCSGSFRGYRVKKLREMGLDRIRSSGFAFYEEILLRLRQAGARFGEFPYEFRDREHGRSKTGLRESVRAVASLLTLALR